ncbi:MAG: pilus assembly protein PilY, partial [Herminiimonas sp.]|nr:pilus assembly protein PilY [Herminiimonas sp.]
FTARDGSGSRQPITVQPKVVFAPGGGYAVLFGTGKYVENADTVPGNFRTQSFYGIHDTTESRYSVAGRSELLPRSVARAAVQNNYAVVVAGDVFSYGAGAENKKGWYFDFPASDMTGERSVTNPVTAYGKLFFNSLIPGSNPCLADGGRSYMLDTLTGMPPTGGPTGFLSEIGLLSSPILLETGTEVGDRNSIGKRSVKKKYAVINSGAGGGKGTIAPAPDGAGHFIPPAGRLSWREVINWQELRDASGKK